MQLIKKIALHHTFHVVGAIVGGALAIHGADTSGTGQETVGILMSIGSAIASTMTQRGM